MWHVGQWEELELAEHSANRHVLMFPYMKTLTKHMYFCFITILAPTYYIITNKGPLSWAKNFELDHRRGRLISSIWLGM